MRLPPFIVTLGTMLLFRGLAEAITLRDEPLLDHRPEALAEELEVPAPRKRMMPGVGSLLDALAPAAERRWGKHVKIHLTSVLVDDQGQSFVFSAGKPGILWKLDRKTGRIRVHKVWLAVDGGIVVQPGAMERAARLGYATATDLADYLVRKGLPFRDAHEVVAHAVKTATWRTEGAALMQHRRSCQLRWRRTAGGRGGARGGNAHAEDGWD